MKLFVHGVPDTPAVWRPVLDSLNLQDQAHTPAIPALCSPTPRGFKGTPDAYVDWLITKMAALAAEHGPLDMVGHDWGGIFTVRAACLRPELVRTWTALNAVPAHDDPWPLVARLWATPFLGEFLMAMSPPSQLEKALSRQRMSDGMAAHEAAHWNRETRSAILKLYRSGMHVGRDWSDGLAALPDTGQVIWSSKDPFTKVGTAETFCARTGAKLTLLEGCGHWSIVECPERVTTLLKEHWAG
jgi:pimeloyl-ACP methyl ester carboxylesterase